MNKEFTELNMAELNEVNGGNGAVDAAFVGGGTVAVAWAPVVAFFCPPAAVAMVCFGTAAIAVGCGKDADIISY